MDCVFCRIVAGEIPATKEYEDEFVVAFRDIHPTAPVHVLVTPKEHVLDLRDASEELVGKVQKALPKVAEKLGIGDDYQVSLNAGKYQEVPHLHYHLKGGMK